MHSNEDTGRWPCPRPAGPDPAWILSSGPWPAGESRVRVPPLSTAFSISRWRGAAPPPTPCPSWALGTQHTWHVQTSAQGGREHPGCGQGLSSSAPVQAEGWLAAVAPLPHAQPEAENIGYE